jgi:hypothetical protein
MLNDDNGAGCQWLMLVILATWETEIRKVEASSQPRQKKKKSQKSLRYRL